LWLNIINYEEESTWTLFYSVVMYLALLVFAEVLDVVHAIPNLKSVEAVGLKEGHLC